MPTPFYHLSLAQELLHHPCLPSMTARFLQSARSEFLFGSTAPDVQVVSGQAREKTHFFRLPILNGDRPAWERFLAEYPDLAAAETLPIAQAAFLAGYLCHLQADWMWIEDVYAPIFGPGCSWKNFHDRLYYHNVLRAYIDQHILAELDANIGACFSQLELKDWLPFVKGHHLAAWRDFLSKQLMPGAAPQTVEVFSARQGIAAPEYYALLGSDKRMQREIFDHISMDQVESYRQGVLVENASLVTDYLVFTLHPHYLLDGENVS